MFVHTLYLSIGHIKEMDMLEALFIGYVGTWPLGVNYFTKVMSCVFFKNRMMTIT